MTELQTFAEWGAQGRSVKKGEKAKSYRIAPDWSEGTAVFSIDQTEERETTDMSEWIVVSADEWKNRNKTPRRLVKLDKLDDGTLSIWCGSDETAIRALRKGGYRFNMKTHRWYHSNKDIEKVIAGFEKYEYEIELGPGASAYLTLAQSL